MTRQTIWTRNWHLLVFNWNFSRESSDDDDDQTTHWPAAFNEPTLSFLRLLLLPKEKSKRRNDFRQSVNSSTAGKRGV